MVSFGVIFAIGALALLLVQRLDIECENSPRRRVVAWHSAPGHDPSPKPALTYSA